MKKRIKMIFLILMVLIVEGCSNVSQSYDSINDSYNRKNKTANRSIIADTIIATALYNNPTLISKLSLGKSKTHSRETINTTTLSATTMESQNFIDGNSYFNMSQSKTRTETRTKSKSKSATTGINVAPNLEYYLK